MPPSTALSLLYTQEKVYEPVLGIIYLNVSHVPDWPLMFPYGVLFTTKYSTSLSFSLLIFQSNSKTLFLLTVPAFSVRVVVVPLNPQILEAADILPESVVLSAIQGCEESLIKANVPPEIFSAESSSLTAA